MQAPTSIQTLYILLIGFFPLLSPSLTEREKCISITTCLCNLFIPCDSTSALKQKIVMCSFLIIRLLIQNWPLFKNYDVWLWHCIVYIDRILPKTVWCLFVENSKIELPKISSLFDEKQRKGSNMCGISGKHSSVKLFWAFFIRALSHHWAHTFIFSRWYYIACATNYRVQ